VAAWELELQLNLGRLPITPDGKRKHNPHDGRWKREEQFIEYFINAMRDKKGQLCVLIVREALLDSCADCRANWSIE
jgi:hypothetical protein